MELIFPYILTFFIAGLLAYLELFSSYKNVLPLFWNSLIVGSYVSLYGGLAVVFLLLINNNIIPMDAVFADSIVQNWNPWFLAICIGLSAKGLMNISFFNIGSQSEDGDKSIPIGTKSIIFLLDREISDSIRQKSYTVINDFLQPYLNKNLSLDDAKTLVLNNLPFSFSGDERKAFEVSIRNLEQVDYIYESVLRKFGSKYLDQLFRK